MDKALQQEKTRERVARHRALQKALHSESVTSKALQETPMTRIEFIQQELNDPFLIKGIEGAARLFQDRDTRYEKAYRYKLWHDDYTMIHPMGTLTPQSHYNG